MWPFPQDTHCVNQYRSNQSASKKASTDDKKDSAISATDSHLLTINRTLTAEAGFVRIFPKMAGFVRSDNQ
jgi:hypothetical protein